MKHLLRWMILPTLLVLMTSLSVQAEEVQPMYGGLIIDGYNYGKDIGPKGSIRYDEKENAFIGFYTGLKMPPGKRAIFAWAHDTVNQRTVYLGPVGWLKRGTSGKNKGKFKVEVPGKFRGGNFGTYEIIGFSAENTSALDGTKVVSEPKEASGSRTLPQLKPAFYLFAKLPGADTELHYCGHGQDFFYAKDLEKQFCYD